MTTRADILELATAAQFVVDVASRYDPHSIAFRVAMRRLEAAADLVLEDPQPPAAGCTADWALRGLLVVIVAVLALALYGLVRTFGWFA